MRQEGTFFSFWHKKDKIFKKWITKRGYFRDLMVSSVGRKTDADMVVTFTSVIF